MQKNAMHDQQQVGKLADVPAQAQMDKLPGLSHFIATASGGNGLCSSGDNGVGSSRN